MEFPRGEITKLAANFISKFMYVQCDVDRNEYLLLESVIDHRKLIQLSIESYSQTAR